MVLNRPTGTTIFVPLEERTALTKKMFVFSPGRPAEFNRIFGFRQEEVRKSIRCVKFFFCDSLGYLKLHWVDQTVLSSKICEKRKERSSLDIVCN